MTDDEAVQLKQEVSDLKVEVRILRSAILESVALSVSVLSAANGSEEEALESIREVQMRLKGLAQYVAQERSIGTIPNHATESEK